MSMRTGRPVEVPTPQIEQTPDMPARNRQQWEASKAKIDEPILCVKCKGSWFFEMDLNQYKKATYSSTIGGSLAAIQDANKQVLMCPCGTAVIPDIVTRVGSESELTCLTSLKAAAAVRNVQTITKDEVMKIVDEAGAKLAEVFVLREDSSEVIKVPVTEELSTDPESEKTTTRPYTKKK